MKLLSTLLLSLILILNLNSCRFFTAANTPFLAGTNIKVPNGTPKFQYGFRHGCGNALNARGNEYYRSKYHYNFDPDLIDDSEYNIGYKRGYGYCVNMMTGGGGHMAGGADLYIYPSTNPTPFNMGAGNINDTVNYGALNWINIPNGGLDGVYKGFSESNSGRGAVFTAPMFWGGNSKGQIFGNW